MDAQSINGGNGAFNRMWETAKANKGKIAIGGVVLAAGGIALAHFTHAKLAGIILAGVGAITAGAVLVSYIPFGRMIACCQKDDQQKKADVLGKKVADVKAPQARKSVQQQSQGDAMDQTLRKRLAEQYVKAQNGIEIEDYGKKKTDDQPVSLRKDKYAERRAEVARGENRALQNIQRLIRPDAVAPKLKNQEREVEVRTVPTPEHRKAMSDLLGDLNTAK